MLSKGKRMIRKKEKTAGCLLLVPLPGRQEPFASQAKNLPPGKGEPLTRLKCPGQSVQKRVPPGKGEPLTRLKYLGQSVQREEKHPRH